ncbi:hypothetical protein [Metallibacterium sp.]
MRPPQTRLLDLRFQGTASRRLTLHGKHPNVTIVAVARELAGFIWDIARMTPLPVAA